MNKANRSFRLASLLPAVLTVSAYAAVAQAQEAAQPSRWSDPATWPNRQVPGLGDKVTIGRDKNVVLDISPPALGGLSIDGKLTFSNDADLELTTEWIMLHGELAIGSEAAPHTRKATITLTDNIKNEDVMAGMGDRGIMISGGTLNLHGNTTNAWTKLAETAKAGATSITVLNASGWRVGDEIVLASTDFNPRQAERRTITAINGNALTLDNKLDYMHFGKVTFDVDERGEVGLITRNIKIQASADAAQSFFGGHIMAMPSSHMYIEGVELNRMGQNLTLARYPVHWHLVGDAKGQYIRNAAIHDTFNRCVTVHGTNELQVENNVTYNTVGHCFFMEDGIEHGNRFVRNLAIQTKCHTSLPCDPTNLAPFGTTSDGLNFKTEGQLSKNVLIPSDNTVSSFWITNPDNAYIDNVAAGSDSTGYWLAFPTHPTGQFEGTEISKTTWPRGTKIREFKGNVAHSNFDGFMMDRSPQPDGTFRTGGHLSSVDPADRNSAQIVSTIENFTAYKNSNGGLWSRGEMHEYKGLKLADNAIGYT
ncbi:MAG: G8 domain-containing protein, partial [Nevskiaceae bacterium]|nr:G8 domain-containing protein [Nevskiaceae bacterium]